MHAKATRAVRACVERASEHGDALAHADETVPAAGPTVQSGGGVVRDLELEGLGS